jgi:hypothetical protein
MRLILGVLGLGLLNSAGHGQGLLELQSKLIPDALEPWQTIAWQVDLAAAREFAGQSNKPLFAWAMNGHPLGCT